MNKNTPSEISIGLKELSIVPREVKGWNWGAFFFGGIWGIANKSYNACWAFIPGFGLLWLFICGIKGNEWAWKNKKWKSIEEFHRVQSSWANWAVIIIVAVILLEIIGFLCGVWLKRTYPNINSYNNYINLSKA
jgi:hypothetical protein